MAGEDMFADTLAELTASQVQEAARSGAAALLPVGVIECHGPHLPTGTDAYTALKLCQLTRRYAAELGRRCVIAPPYYWGINGILNEFPGSFRIRAETAAALLSDVIGSLFANAFQDVLIVSHHGDRLHNEMIRDVLTELHVQGHTRARWLYAPFRWRMFERLGMSGEEPIWVPWAPTPALDDFKVTGILGVHADEYETAAMVRFFPDTVDYDALRGLPPTRLTLEDLQDWRKGGEDAKRLTPDGYFGAPNPIDPELWRHYDETARVMARAIL
ncbi:creatininase family protein [Polymorphum gilvum]|uniref:Creatininase n=1 Tax=Polymorphum gilvum (strain LMG 25793 / CGMCC 1.9160 / SL003B-26A1) TaxID=991905 RepID=F2IWX4_POLGS|nr:creatininase family protein [Polymorphum gilvum]ADZ71551.1 Creatininase [Polymorphum gilvum SL003B-26A1]